jgi:hypothetical protein
MDSITRSHAPDDGVALGGVELALVDLLAERLLESRHHLVGGALLATAQADLEPGLGRDLGDAGAHDPGADDSDALDRHDVTPSASRNPHPSCRKGTLPPGRLPKP